MYSIRQAKAGHDVRFFESCGGTTRGKDLKRLLNWLREHQPDISKLLFFLAGIYGVVCVVLYPPQFGPPTEMGNVAENIAKYGSFANPFFVLQTGPTAAIPPLYPFLLAGLIKLLHSSHLVYLAAILGCILADSVVAALLPRVSALFYGDCLPGIIASVLWIGAMPLIPSYDVSYTVLGILAFCLLTWASVTEGRGALKSAVLGGVIAALLLLFNPATLLLTVPWALFLLWRGSKAPKVRLICCCLIVSLMAIPIGVWGTRNYYRLGAFALRITMGMTLYASNNDCAEVDIFRDQLYGCYESHHPNTSLAEAQLLRRLGEVKYDHERVGDVEDWIYHHPHRFALLTMKRMVRFWFPQMLPSSAEILTKGGYAIPEQVRGWIAHRNWVAYVICVITALSIPGLFLMARNRVPITIYVLFVLGIYPLMYYIVIADVRFRYPVLWLSLLPAGYFLAYLAEAGQRRPREDEVAVAAVSER